VPEEVLLEEGHAGDNAGFTASRERVEFELRGDKGGDEFGTRRGGGVNIRLVYLEGGGASNSAAVPAPIEDLLSVNMSLGSPSNRYLGKLRLNIPAHQMFGVI